MNASAEFGILSRALVFPSCIRVGRRCFGDAKQSQQRFQRDPDIKGPEKEPHESSDQVDKPLGRGGLKADDHDRDSGDLSDQQVQAVEELSIADRHTLTK